MKLTVLGCWAPYPRAGGACSGYLLQSGNKNILIDCGNGVLSNLQKHLDFRQLDAVVISHFHPDHYLDLFCLRHAVSGARRLDPKVRLLPVFMPETPAGPFQKLGGYTEAFIVRPIEKLTASARENTSVYTAVVGSDDGAGGVRVSFVRTDHPLPAYAAIFEGEGRLFYSADTRWCDYLPGFAAEADMVLCEASVTEADREYTSAGHLTARQAGELARAAHAGQLMITHFWPGYNLGTIEKEAEAGFGRPVITAREGLEVKVK